MEKTIVCFGDSIVYGYGAGVMDAWPKRAAKALNVKIYNRGDNGNTTDDLIFRFTEDVLMIRPEAVVILGGANDILMGTRLCHTQENIAYMVEKAKAAGIRPILCTLLPVDGPMLKRCWFSFYDADETIGRIDAFSQWIRTYCAKNDLLCIDFNKLYPDYMRRAGYEKMYQDGVHPTKDGYHMLAKIFCDVYTESK